MDRRTSTEADPRRLKVHRRPPARDVPYVPTDEPVVTAMLRFAGLNSNDVVYDLGCGDGRIVIAAAKLYGCQGVGVDIDPLRIQESRENAHKARVEHLVRFHCQSFFETDLRGASVVMLYLLPGINCRLRPKLLSELKPGSRIVANYFDMGDWRPDMTAEAHHRHLMQWIVPADVDGTWKCVVNTPGKRQHVQVHLKRCYQVVTGTAQIGRRHFQITNGRLFADQLTFKLYALDQPTPRFACRVEGGTLRGSCQFGAEGPTYGCGGLLAKH